MGCNWYIIEYYKGDGIIFQYEGIGYKFVKQI